MKNTTHTHTYIYKIGGVQKESIYSKSRKEKKKREVYSSLQTQSPISCILLPHARAETTSGKMAEPRTKIGRRIRGKKEKDGEKEKKEEGKRKGARAISPQINHTSQSNNFSHSKKSTILHNMSFHTNTLVIYLYIP